MFAAHRPTSAPPPRPALPGRLRAAMRRCVPRRPAFALALLPALLAATLLAGPAAAATPTPPRLQDFTDYSLYVQAMVDYQRALEEPPKAEEKKDDEASKLCQDSQGGSKDEKKKNSCEGKYLTVEHRLADDYERKAKDKPKLEPEPAAPAESLEETIARRSTSFLSSTGQFQGGSPDSTPRGFPLQELASADLSEAGVAGLLGLFNNVRIQNLSSSAAPGGIFGAATGGSSAGGSGSSLMNPDGTMNAMLDNILIELSTINLDQLASTVSFGDGYSIVSATVRTQGTGLSIGLSAQAYTSVYIVDRDGLPRTSMAGAGAVVVDHMAILVPYVEANIQSVRTTSNDSSLLNIDLNSPDAIYVNLANTSVGVAPATADGSQIGTSTPFLLFGPDALLTIAPGTRLRASVSKPDGLNTAFVTLNGRVGDISLGGMRLVDNNSGGSVGFGRLAMTNLELVDAKIYMSDKSVVVDTGRSFSNIGINVERFYLGSEGVGSFVGDFYARGGTVNNLRMTATPH